MGKISKKRLLVQAKREHEQMDRPLVMTSEVESRFLAMNKAEARKDCPLCGAPFNPTRSSYHSSGYNDWWVEKLCPKCGVIEETADGVRKKENSHMQTFLRVLERFR